MRKGIPVDGEIQDAFDEGEPILLYVRGGQVRWSRLMSDYTGSIDMHFSQGTPDEIRATNVERPRARDEVELREG
jgi:hypothetical protein